MTNSRGKESEKNKKEGKGDHSEVSVIFESIARPMRVDVRRKTYPVMWAEEKRRRLLGKRARSLRGGGLQSR